MNKFLVSTLLVLALGSCSNNNNQKLETFITGAEIAGVNGMHFGPDGFLYAASVIGSDITVIDTENKNIVKRYGLSEGVIGPDDVAFNSKGEFFWTSILTGEVAGFNTKGEKVIAGNPGPGVNPITFSDDDRLFVAQCFFGNGLFEWIQCNHYYVWPDRQRQNLDNVSSKTICLPRLRPTCCIHLLTC